MFGLMGLRGSSGPGLDTVAAMAAAHSGSRDLGGQMHGVNRARGES